MNGKNVSLYLEFCVLVSSLFCSWNCIDRKMSLCAPLNGEADIYLGTMDRQMIPEYVSEWTPGALIFVFVPGRL